MVNQLSFGFKPLQHPSVQRGSTANPCIFSLFRTLCPKNSKVGFRKNYLNSGRSSTGVDHLRDGCTNRRSLSVHGLVHRYFAKLNRFCTQSSIVPWTPPRYTLSSTRRIPLTGSE